MAYRTAGTGSRKLPLPVILGAVLTLFLYSLPAGPASAADLAFSSRTYGLLYERDYAGVKKEKYAPLYEYLTMDTADLGGKPLFFHFSGWGRYDLKEDSGGDDASGEISSLYLEYLHPEGNAQAKLGRFFLAEGVAMDTLDGAFAKMTTPVGLGISLYAGIPVEYSILDNVERGDSLFGGRVFYALAGVLELGVSYLKEDGSTGAKDRELYGGDLWLQVAKGVEINGQAAYNGEANEMASQRYAIRFVPSSTYDITAGYESYTYEGLFRSALNPVFLSPSADNTDDVGKIFIIVDWGFAPGWTLEVAGKNIRHESADPGDANRGEIGLRYGYNGGKDMAGTSIAFTAADRDENEYTEFRAFASYSPDKLRLTLDAIVQYYKESISAKKNAYQVVATAGYRLLDALQLSGNLTYSRDPVYEKDFAGLVRLSYDFGIKTGGTKK